MAFRGSSSLAWAKFYSFRRSDNIWNICSFGRDIQEVSRDGLKISRKILKTGHDGLKISRVRQKIMSE